MINIKKYLEDMLKDRRSKYKNKEYEEEETFFWGQICLLEEILNDIKNNYIKINKKLGGNGNE